MTVVSGSALWLLRHELRLYWRTGFVKQMSSMFLYAALILMHVVAGAIAFSLEFAPPMPAELRVMITTGLIWFVFVTMLSRCLHLVIEAIYTRRDMELLLTSPLAPAAFIGARAMSIAITVTLEFAALLFPFANVFVLMGYLGWLKAYLMVPAFAMLAASVALPVALGLFRMLGPRRTQVFAQIMASVIGIAFLVLSLLPGMAPRPNAQDLGKLGHRASVGASDLLWQPARMLLNGFGPALLFALGCGALFLLAVKTLGSPFVSASLQSAASTNARRAHSGATMVFRSDVKKILVSKEMRLLARDPGLLSQLLQQLVYAIPIAYLLWKSEAGGTPWIWLSLILVVGSCAGALSWLVFTAEDAPDLLATSPVPRKVLVRAKLEAVLTPVLVLISVPLFVLLKRHPVFAVVLVLCSAGCAVSCAMLNAGGEHHRKRAQFNARHKGAPGSGIVEVLVIAAWMLLCAGFMRLSPWA